MTAMHRQVDLNRSDAFISLHQPCNLEIIVERELTNERAAQAFSRHREAAHITTSAVLRDWIGETKLEDSVVALDALKRLPNLRILRMRLTREAMDAVIAADLPLEKLETLHIDVQEASTQALASFLSKLPNLRTLRFGPLVCNVREDDPAPPALVLPHLRAYAQTRNFALYREPMDAAWRTLRSLSVCSSGSLPDLSGLVALSRLTLRLFGSLDNIPLDSDLSVHEALLRCRRLRHLDIFNSLDTEPLMDTLAVLVRQLATLKLRIYGHATVSCPILEAHVPRFFPHDAPSALRSLAVEVQTSVAYPADEPSFVQLGRTLTPVCRARRVAFFLGKTRW